MHICTPTVTCTVNLIGTGCYRNENDVFLAFSLGMREGVDEDSRHGIRYVAIQVGSCICLNAFVLNHCMCT